VFSSLAAGLNHGFRRGMWNAVGMQVANFNADDLRVVGLGAILLASENLFNAVKWGGVAYLVWLGIVTWRSAPQPLRRARRRAPGQGLARGLPEGFPREHHEPQGHHLLRGRAAQFIDVSRPQFAQYAILGLTTLVVDLGISLNNPTQRKKKKGGKGKKTRQKKKIKKRENFPRGFHDERGEPKDGVLRELRPGYVDELGAATAT